MQEEPLHTFIKFLFKTSIVVVLGYELLDGNDLSLSQSLMPGIFFGGIIYKLVASPLVEGVDRFVDRFRNWIAQAS